MDEENTVFRALVEKLPGEHEVSSHVVTTDDGYLLKLFRIKLKGALSDGVHPPILL